jgi:hypothetical protein
MKTSSRNFIWLARTLVALAVGLAALQTTQAATNTLPAGILATAYSYSLTATGGTAPYVYTLAGGSLPGGLTLAGDGTLSGSPTNAGTFLFQLLVTDTNSCTGVKECSLTVASVTASTLTGATMLPGGTFQFAFTNTPGAGFSVFGATNISLPYSNWSFLGSLTDNPPGQFLFTDPQATNHLQRFYRVRSP